MLLKLLGGSVCYIGFRFVVVCPLTDDLWRAVMKKLNKKEEGDKRQ